MHEGVNQAAEILLTSTAHTVHLTPDSTEQFTCNHLGQCLCYYVFNQISNKYIYELIWFHKNALLDLDIKIKCLISMKGEKRPLLSKSVSYCEV